MKRVPVIGLTGGIASGKSTVAESLRRRGAAIVDADAIAREVVAPGQPALAELVARFGEQIVTADGQLDRKRLADIAFADPNARSDLNRITHPRIAAASHLEIERHAAAGAPWVFYEAALLVENRAHEWLDAVIVVSAPPEVQRQRLMERDGLSAADADARIAAQLPLADKLAVATWVIDNRGFREDIDGKVDQLLAAVAAKFGAPRPDAQRSSGSQAAVDPDDRVASPERVLITGFPGMVCRRLAARVLAAAGDHVVLLTRSATAEAAAAFVAGLDATARGRCHVIVGDVADMHLGLAADEYKGLLEELTTIVHLAGPAGGAGEGSRRFDLIGTQNILETATEARRLRRLVHVSTVRVSGRREGVVLEDDLDGGQSFHNAMEETQFQAELLVRSAMRKVPITVVRPATIVGDSKTGEIDAFDGPYHVFSLIANRPQQIQLPIPGRSSAPLHLVPVDYVVESVHALATDPRAASKTFHLCDPNPLPARRVYELIAEHAHTRAPRSFISDRLARTLMRTPGIEKLARGPLAFLSSVDEHVFYHRGNTVAVLDTAGIQCPRFEDYVAALVQYLQERSAPSNPSRPATAPSEPDDEL